MKEGIIILYLGLIIIACLFFYSQRASLSLVADSKLQLPIKRMEMLIVFAPFVSVVVFSILFLTVLKGQLADRISHALIVFSLWIFFTYFIKTLFGYWKNKNILLVTFVGILLTLYFIIQLTPLDNYTKLVFLKIGNFSFIIGIVLIILFYSNYLHKRKFGFARVN
ncbi:hypothetical protein [Lysinibacillus xylanilyticus]|uniref:Uncharacterized protein n=1 Tax=Lysinibacillus xylanilyticus TaxID=582475 RepID=A0ABT4EUH3_9BACI|nr:hypothetical protein [Lysinibacillus xylanilyticus]MCY9549324.1 hypothetical protein [Lysinibacillus xylanilyticus]MED3803562.1 hypothetical protein [Lysinibacillus xylanilyticus]